MKRCVTYQGVYGHLPRVVDRCGERTLLSRAREGEGRPILVRLQTKGSTGRMRAVLESQTEETDLARGPLPCGNGLSVRPRLAREVPPTTWHHDRIVPAPVFPCDSLPVHRPPTVALTLSCQRILQLKTVACVSAIFNAAQGSVWNLQHQPVATCEHGHAGRPLMGSEDFATDGTATRHVVISPERCDPE